VTGIPTDGHARVRDEALAQISRNLVEFHRRYYGQGPTKAKTGMLDNMVVCTLVGDFATVERTLIEAGDRESVHRIRLGFLEGMEDEFRRIVEESTGRKAIAYMSAVHLGPEVAVELFVLEALPGQEQLTDPGEFAEVGGG
jgi:uncharacterized protein YbcI